MTALRREESRPFDLERSHPLDEVLEDPSALPSRVVSMADALPDWPRAVLGEDEAKQVKNGVRLSTRGQAGAGARALFLGPDETPLALAEARAEGDDVRWHIERGLW
jgi:tRNA pseudouridine55 synthase